MQSSARSVISAVGPGADLLTEVDYRLAETHEEKEEIYNLRYRAYLREGAVKESPDSRVTDRYDDLPNSWTFGVYLQGELCSSVRISVLTSEWRASTSTDVFPDILLPRLDRGEVMIDPTRFVADPDKAKRVPELPYLTLRIAYMACEHFKADVGLAIVRAEHQAFYRRVFLHATIAEPRLVPGLTKPFGLMAADFPTFRKRVFERYPVMRSTAFERRMLFGRRGERQAAQRRVLVADAAHA
ncbi:N-acyl amino acid synthase FeeM domain-containing protein [Bradyrhizobium sp. UFLA05-112]